MLKALNIKLPYLSVMRVYLSAQPVSLLPAGELYRSVLLEKEFKVPIIKSAATVTMQGLVEAVVLVLFSLIGVFVIGVDRVLVTIIGILLLLLFVGLQRNWLVGLPKYLNKLPFVHINLDKARKFITDHQALLQPRIFSVTFLLSIVPVLSGISIFYLSSHTVHVPITIAQASIGYSLPVVVSGLSFLPGGVGSSEGSSIIFLQYVGVGAAAAVTITLLVRIFTLGMGLIFGCSALLITRIFRRKHEDVSTHKS